VRFIQVREAQQLFPCGYDAAYRDKFAAPADSAMPRRPGDAGAMSFSPDAGAILSAQLESPDDFALVSINPTLSRRVDWFPPTSGTKPGRRPFLAVCSVFESPSQL